MIDLDTKIKEINDKFESLKDGAGQYHIKNDRQDYVRAFNKTDYSDYIGQEESVMDSYSSVEFKDVKDEDIVIVHYLIGQDDGDRSFVLEGGSQIERVDNTIQFIANEVIENLEDN